MFDRFERLFDSAAFAALLADGQTMDRTNASRSDADEIRVGSATARSLDLVHFAQFEGERRDLSPLSVESVVENVRSDVSRVAAFALPNGEFAEEKEEKIVADQNR